MFQKCIEILCPYQCCLCGQRSKRGQDLCEYCYEGLPWAADRDHAPGERAWFFDRLCALWEYQFPVIRLVHGLKFQENLAYARIMGELLAEAVSQQWYRVSARPQAIIPMPLHPQRLQKRGYNQAVELARAIHKKTDLPVLSEVCVRVRKTQAQAKLAREARFDNVKGAFALRNNISLPEHIAIVDDVMTTGFTVDALSRLLKQVGVQRIDVWCACRA
jgi:ComF family protein